MSFIDKKFDQKTLEWVRGRIQRDEDFYYQVISKQKRDYYKRNQDKKKEYSRKYHKENKLRKNEYVKNKYKNDINYRLSELLRCRIRTAIKQNKKQGSAVKDLGCTLGELKRYLEEKFEVGMTWENHGEWHIDHKKPLCTFDLSNREDFLKACHYTNLQPLWRKDNLEKGKKYYDKEK